MWVTRLAFPQTTTLWVTKIAAWQVQERYSWLAPTAIMPSVYSNDLPAPALLLPLLPSPLPFDVSGRREGRGCQTVLPCILTISEVPPQ